MPRARQQAIKDFFSNKEAAYSEMSDSLLADFLTLQPQIKKWKSAQGEYHKLHVQAGDCSEFLPRNNSYLNALIQKNDKLIAQYDAFPQVIPKAPIKASSSEEEVHQFLTNVMNGINRNLKTLPEEEQEKIKVFLSELPGSLKSTNKDLAAECLMLKPYISEWRSIQKSHLEFTESFNLTDDLELKAIATSLVKLHDHFEALGSAIDLNADSKAQIEKISQEKIRKYSVKKQGVETVLNSRLLASYINTWFLPTALSKLGVEQDIENVLIQAFGNLSSSIMQTDKLAAVFPAAITGATNAVSNLTNAENIEKVKSLAKSDDFKMDSWGASAYSDRYFEQFTGPIIKKNVP